MQRDKERFKAILPPVPDDANKYSRGSVVVLAGSGRFPGAAVLTASAAARTGAGYTSLVTPKSAAPIAQMHLCSIPVVSALESEGAFVKESLSEALNKISHINALVVGPGLTATKGTRDFVITLLQNATVPLLIDADGLNVLAMELDVESTSESELTPESREVEASKSVHSGIDALRDCTANRVPVILTPHEGELKRLAWAAVVSADAESLAKVTGAIVVAKGSRTSISDGTTTILSEYGTAALAKAGTGDVLSGVIGSLIAQGVAPLPAAELGVYIHSLSGLYAQQELGLRGVMAEDLLAQIPRVIKDLEC